MPADNDFDLFDYLNLGNILIRQGKLSKKQVNAALTHQKRVGGRLGEHLVGLGYCDPEDVREALKTQEEQRDLPSSKADGALQRLEAAIDSFEASGKKLSKLSAKKSNGKVVIDLAEDQSGAVPISPPNIAKLVG